MGSRDKRGKLAIKGNIVTKKRNGSENRPTQVLELTQAFGR